MNHFVARTQSAWAKTELQARAFWASLPHQVQAGVVVFATAALTTLSKELQALLFGTAHFTRSSLQHDLGAAITAGILAVRAFYMLPNKPAVNPQPSGLSEKEPSAVE